MSDLPAIVLAAGSSRRFGSANKLLARLDGKPLISLVVDTVLESGVFSRVFVVTGHENSALKAALAGRDVTFVFNRDHAEGMASSLRVGLSAAARRGTGAAMIFLGDMPSVSPDTIRTLAEQHRAHREAIIRPVHAGKPGNPVVLPQSVFDAAMRLQGDEGARGLIASKSAPVIDVDLGADVVTDIDTAEALENMQKRS